MAGENAYNEKDYDAKMQELYDISLALLVQ